MLLATGGSDVLIDSLITVKMNHEQGALALAPLAPVDPVLATFVPSGSTSDPS